MNKIQTGLALTNELQANQQNKYKDSIQQKALKEWFHKEDFDRFVTLTFMKQQQPLAANRTLKEFFNRVERKCFGRRHKRKNITRLPVLEHTANASHFHVALKKPSNWSDDDFKRLLRDQWSKLKGTGFTNLLLRNNGKDSSWYEKILDADEDKQRVVGYMAKGLDRNFSTLGIDNIRI